MIHRARFLVLVLTLTFVESGRGLHGADAATPVKTLPTEKLSGEGIWVMPALQQQANRASRVTVWFEDQFLGAGESYRRRATDCANWKRRELRDAVVATLKAVSDKSYAAASESLDALVDDYHGYNFAANTPQLTTREVPPNSVSGQLLHGSMCAAIVCGAGRAEAKHEFGLAPEGRWAGVIAGPRLEAAVQWAIEQQADTYSMSFSIPNLGDYRSHWRKVMEHGSFCGVYFVSGAGNFAQTASIPVQMRIPEDIPEVVFAAAGVQRDLSRTPFSSQGPVSWDLEHYKDGLIQKPEVCAFNMELPLMAPDGQVRPTGINGNSYAGPMFCGAIALMVSADPDLLPWDLKEIITSTALDVASEGVDYETGHGLINCYRAVKEVLRRKAVREGTDALQYEGREAGDQLDVRALQESLTPRFTVGFVQPSGEAAKKGVRAGDIIVKCAGQPIANMQEFRAAKALASNTNAKTVTVEFERDGKSISIDFVPGNWGMAVGPSFGEPVFR